MDSRKLTKIYTPTDGRVASLPKNATVQRPEVGVNLSKKSLSLGLTQRHCQNLTGERVNNNDKRVIEKSEGLRKNPIKVCHEVCLGGVNTKLCPCILSDASLNNNSSRLNRFLVLRSFKELMKESIAPKENLLRCPTLTTGNLHKFVIINLERWVKRLRKMPATSNKIVKELLLSGQNRAMTSIKSIAEDNYVVPQA